MTRVGLPLERDVNGGKLAAGDYLRSIRFALTGAGRLIGVRLVK